MPTKDHASQSHKQKVNTTPTGGNIDSIGEVVKVNNLNQQERGGDYYAPVGNILLEQTAVEILNQLKIMNAYLAEWQGEQIKEQDI